RLLDLLVGEFLDIGQHHDFSKLLGQFSKSLKQFLVGELLRDRLRVNGGLLQFLSFAEDEAPEPFPALMRNHVEQDTEQPCATVGAGCESLKRLECLKVRLLYRIFRLGAVVEY